MTHAASDARRPRTGSRDRTTITWMTCCGDRHEHAVTDHNFVAGALAGTYRTICGHTAAPASLSSPPGPRCPSCQAELHKQPAPPPSSGHKSWLDLLRRSRRLQS